MAEFHPPAGRNLYGAGRVRFFGQIQQVKDTPGGGFDVLDIAQTEGNLFQRPRELPRK